MTVALIVLIVVVVLAVLVAIAWLQRRRRSGRIIATRPYVPKRKDP